MQNVVFKSLGMECGDRARGVLYSGHKRHLAQQLAPWGGRAHLESSWISRNQGPLAAR